MYREARKTIFDMGIVNDDNDKGYNCRTFEAKRRIRMLCL